MGHEHNLRFGLGLEKHPNKRQHQPDQRSRIALSTRGMVRSTGCVTELPESEHGLGKATNDVRRRTWLGLHPSKFLQTLIVPERKSGKWCGHWQARRRMKLPHVSIGDEEDQSLVLLQLLSCCRCRVSAACACRPRHSAAREQNTLQCWIGGKSSWLEQLASNECNDDCSPSLSDDLMS